MQSACRRVWATRSTWDTWGSGIQLSAGAHQVMAVFVRCTVTANQVQLSQEHDAYGWIDPADRHSFNMMEPDCFVVDKLAIS